MLVVNSAIGCFKFYIRQVSSNKLLILSGLINVINTTAQREYIHNTISLIEDRSEGQLLKPKGLTFFKTLPYKVL